MESVGWQVESCGCFSWQQEFSGSPRGSLVGEEHLPRAACHLPSLVRVGQQKGGLLLEFSRIPYLDGGVGSHELRG